MAEEGCEASWDEKTLLFPSGLQLPCPQLVRFWKHTDCGKCKYQVPPNHGVGRALLVPSRSNILFNIVY